MAEKNGDPTLQPDGSGNAGNQPSSQQQPGSGSGDPNTQAQPTVAELEAKNRELYARAKRAEDRLRERGDDPANDAAPSRSQHQPTNFDPAALQRDIDVKVDLRLEGFSKTDISFMEAVAKGKGIALADAAKDEDVLAAIDARRAKGRSAEATPAPSGRGSAVPPMAELKKMSKAERAEKIGFDAWKQKNRQRGGAQAQRR